MYFNAMRRKGWQPEERDMSLVVSIHNTVNEQAWQHVMEWEKLHKCDRRRAPLPHARSPTEVKLKKFMGRAKDFSPKARIRSLFGWGMR